MHRTAFLASSAFVLTLMATTKLAAQQVVDIPAQPLADALKELGNETGLQVLAPADAVAGKTSRAVKGEMTAHEALGQMLAETGLEFRTHERNGAVLTFGDVISQNATDEEPFELGTLVLRGELIDRSVQDSQTSAVVIAGEDLERRADNNIFGVIERTAGVTVANGAQGFSIRGIPQSEISSGRGSSGTISVTVDGSAVSDFRFGLQNGPYSLWDLEQVEILRGPQSTQSGRNALAGAVKFRSKDPTFEREFRFRALAGTDGLLGGAFAVNVPNATETLSFRFSGDVNRGDGFVTNTTLEDDEAGAYEDETYRFGVRWDPNDRLSLIAKYTYFHEEEGFNRVRTDLFPARITESEVFEEITSDSDILNFRLGYELNQNLRLEYEFVFTDSEFFSLADLDNLATVTGSIERLREFRSAQHEIKLRYDISRLRAVAGLFYTDFDVESVSSGFVPSAFVPNGSDVFKSTVDDSVRNMSVFAEVEYDLSDRWTAIGGFRYDYEEFDSVSTSTFQPAGFPPGPDPTPDKTSGNYSAFLPKLGVVYTLSEDQSLGLTYQRGYRAGGQELNRAGVLSTFDPEYTTNYELSYRSAWLDGRLTANANVFYTQWTDQQVTVRPPTDPANFTIENAAESEVFGGELEFRANPTPDWDLFASAGYAKTKFTDFQAFTGNEFPDAPRWTAAVGATRYFQNGWYVGGDVSFTDSSFGSLDNDPAFDNDSRVIANLQFGYRQGNWEINGFVRNLFDADYLTQRATVNGQPIGVAGEPLTAGIAFQERF